MRRPLFQAPRDRPHPTVVWILCAFSLLGALYSIASPLFEPSDEHNHYPFVQHLATGGGLPIQRPGERTLWGQEGSQPPLYYALSALLTSWISTDDLCDLLYRNPHDRRGVPGATANVNMYIHSPDEDFPWRGTALAVHVIRLASVLLGAGTILCGYWIARRLFPGRPVIALTAIAINAFLPMFLFVGASVNNDNLAILLSSVTQCLLIRLLQRGVSIRLLASIGLVIGLACITKLSALGLLPLTWFALALWAFRDAGVSPGRAWRPVFVRWTAHCALITALVTMIAGWWYLRNWQLYGDPLGLNAMVAIAGGRPPVRSLTDLLDEFRGFRYSFWGVLGGFNVLLRPIWVYNVLDALSVLAFVGLVVTIGRARRMIAAAPWRELLLLGVWIIIEAVALLRWTSTTMASQGRLMFAALAPICLFMALGLLGWLPLRWQRSAAGVIGGLLFLLAASTPFTAILPAYAAAPTLTAADVPASAQRFDVDYGGVMRLLAFDIDRERIRPSETVDVTLYWQMLQSTIEDFSIYLQLIGWRQDLAQIDSYPGGGTRPTSRLAAGQVLADRYQLRVRPDVRGPAPAWIAVGLYSLRSQEKLPARDATGQPVIFPILTKLALDAGTATLVGTHPMNANLGGRVRLTSYDLAASPIQPGQEMTTTLYWQVTSPIPTDYQVFLHLRDRDDRTVAQTDTAPLQGFYRTSAWQVGEILNDTIAIAIPAQLTTGDYRLIAGMYDPLSGQRLSLHDAAGKEIGNEILVTEVHVAKP